MKKKTRWAELNAFVDRTARMLPNRGDLLVYLTLFRHARDGNVRVSQAQLIETTGMSRSGIRRVIERLKSVGLIRVKFQGGWNKGATVYQIRPVVKGFSAEPEKLVVGTENDNDRWRMAGVNGDALR